MPEAPKPLTIDDPHQALPSGLTGVLPSPNPALGNNDANLPPPTNLGRYRVVSQLGRGGFGIVYLAYDDELRRSVAIKVPHRRWIKKPADLENYILEARTLARLDHPNIVPVHDIGRTEDGMPLVVTKYIEGGDLAKRMRVDRLGLVESAQLVKSMAEALHYAHREGLVHRDVKPGNILIDQTGRPHLVDFGMVLREEEFGKGPVFAGTPTYMSPEQARSEGHRVDGRSDVFSLGVVFYELLTGRLPFRGDSRDELLEQIIDRDPRPPRQIDDKIPRELERICLKALAKTASQRYSTAKDFADDLRTYLESAAPAAHLTPQRSPQVKLPPPTPTPRGLPRVVPRGLRSFDADDADFFLELLPGPTDRNGIPESIRFWQRRVLESDADQTFAIGLIYGPSGCGKSSFVKAGLLAHLPPRITAVYLEASGDVTEDRLLSRLRKICPSLPPNLNLIESLAYLRRGDGLHKDEKVLIVLDQFEQWLHTRRGRDQGALVRALRQCDGGRVQCLLLIRDDFWMAVTRLMRELDIRIVEGENAAAIDLFDVLHAKRVLAMLGRAYGAIPDESPKGEHEKFIQQAIEGLSQEGKVISIRLSLFAEMVKARPWTPATLKAIGGIAGVGVTFLEESLSASSAPPWHRAHQGAARQVLKALMPELGNNLKGHMRSHDELLTASGYADRPQQFEELLQILHRELRLVSPLDVEGVQLDSEQRKAMPQGQQYYQLTHDYLVPALREWLTRKQKETRRGRAELRLAERAAIWEAKPLTRNLPSFFDWMNIRWWTRNREWSIGQKRMMKRAALVYGVTALLASFAMILATGYSLLFYSKIKAESLRDQLLRAKTGEVLKIIHEMKPHRPMLDPLLIRSFEAAKSKGNPDEQLRLSLALLPSDSNQVTDLYERMLSADAADFSVIRSMLNDYKDSILQRLRQDLEIDGCASNRGFRAACALASYSPQSMELWKKLAPNIVAKLVMENPLDVVEWKECLRPIGDHLLESLADALQGSMLSDVHRRVLTKIYQTYAIQSPATDDYLEQALASTALKTPEETPAAKARRQANAAAALAAIDREKLVWPLLIHRPDPTLRSQIIERLGAGGIEIGQLEKRLRIENNDTARRAVVLAIGSFPPDRLTSKDKDRLAQQLLLLYKDDPDSGIHGATDWVLRTWGYRQHLAQIDSELATGKVEGNRRWFINRLGQTMLVIKAPGEVQLGKEGNRKTERISHSFAIAAKEVTIREFRSFRANHQYAQDITPTQQCPVNLISWYLAVEFCEWLNDREGIPASERCYLRNDQHKFGEGMKIVANYQSRKGYRLPTEAEWEYACRALATTDWSCGKVDDDLFCQYATYFKSSYSDGNQRRLFPVGSRKPNDFGLFDMHGNVSEFCQNRFNQQQPEDTNQDEMISIAHSRAVRGGSYSHVPAFQRSDYRIPAAIEDVARGVGIRLIRTLD